MKTNITHVGFIGQGWIGKNMADNFETRGYEVVRYSLEEPYVKNKDKLELCEVVFVAVPTPTRDKKFDLSILEDALESLNAPDTIVVIKSTILPGSTEYLQEKFPQLIIIHSPEFLREKHVVSDIANPDRTIIGITSDDHWQAAKDVVSILPESTYEAAIVPARVAEMVKYVGNMFLMNKLVFFNAMYDISNILDIDWESVRRLAALDARIGESHTHVVGKDGERGAGGHCFPKDFEAMLSYVDEDLNPPLHDMFQGVSDYNRSLLVSTDKDLDIVEEVYGEQ